MDEVIDPFNTANDDIWGTLADFKPEEVKDEGGFAPFKGSYVTVIKKLVHQIGVSKNTNEPFNSYSLSTQVVEVIEGDKALNRYLQKRYQNTAEGIKKLMNDLFTAGIEFAKGSREEFDLSLPNAIDKQMRVRAWSWTPEKKMDGTPIPEEQREPIQQFKVVAEFKGKGKAKSTGEAPF